MSESQFGAATSQRCRLLRTAAVNQSSPSETRLDSATFAIYQAIISQRIAEIGSVQSGCDEQTRNRIVRNHTARSSDATFTVSPSTAAPSVLARTVAHESVHSSRSDAICLVLRRSDFLPPNCLALLFYVGSSNLETRTTPIGVSEHSQS